MLSEKPNIVDIHMAACGSIEKDISLADAKKMYSAIDKTLNKVYVTHKQIQDFKGSDYEASIKSPINFQAQFLDTFAEGYDLIGDTLPWFKSHSNFRFRTNELTLWSGYSGHKKSLTLGQVILWLILQGKKCIIASMEMSAAKLLRRIAKQALCNENPPHDKLVKFLEFLQGKLFIFDQKASVDKDWILKMTEYASAELKVDHVFIDSLMMCGMRATDWDAQKDFIADLKKVTNNYPIHTHLVVHMRKPDFIGEGGFLKVPSKFEISGGSDIFNQADNVIIVWTNAKKLRESRKPVEMRNQEVMDKTGMLVLVDKQREGEWEDGINLEFDSRSLQVIEYKRYDYYEHIL